jgi:O-methyltransferase involved in polyketide biosynthesis
MNEHRPSLTSEMVALYRAMHARMHPRPILVDPYAVKLVRPTWGLAARSRAAYRVLRAIT